jgi:serine phosphatase RsbU (regulator of sigma subunit)
MAPVQRLATGMIVLLALGMIVPTIGVALLARGQRSDTLESEQALLEGRTGKTMREQLLPRYTPMLGGWEVAVHYHPATSRATARDFHDFMLLPDGRLMVALATVADQGLHAVHLMTSARAAFRTAACQTSTGGGLSAGRVLSQCNNLLCPDVGPHTAITSLFALLDPSSGRLQVASAGFCAPLRRSAADLIEMREGPHFLGQELDVEFEHDDVLLAPGDAILFYSPGALGVQPETGEPFGPERVRRVLNAANAHSAQAIVDALRTDLAEFADAASLRKLDVTFLALSRAPAPPGAGKGELKAARSLRDELRALGETETDL